MTSPSCNLDQVTRNLREVRTEWRTRHRTADIAAHRLPSVVAVEHIAERLLAALYPQRLGTFGSHGPEEDAFVTGELRDALSTLLHQLNFEPALPPTRALGRLGLDTTIIIREFAESLSVIRRLTDADIEAAQAIAATSTIDEILLCAAAPLAILRYRIAHQLYVLGAPLIAQIMARAAYALTGVYIHPSAEVGPYFSIEHGGGTTVGANSQIGAHVRLHQGVALGGPLPRDADVHRDETSTRGAILGDYVEVHAGANIPSGLVVGKGSIIGPNVSLAESVPPDSIVLQAGGLTRNYKPRTGRTVRAKPVAASGAQRRH